MAPRVSKTEVLWVTQGNYGYGHGWEDLTFDETYREGRQSLRDYRDNEPGPHRLIQRRVPKGQARTRRPAGRARSRVGGARTREAGSTWAARNIERAVTVRDTGEFGIVAGSEGEGLVIVKVRGHTHAWRIQAFKPSELRLLPR